MKKWLQKLWEDMIVWPGMEFSKFERIFILGLLLLVAAVVSTTVHAGSTPQTRRHLDDLQDIELCAYRAGMTEISARYWNLGKRNWQEIYSMIAWHGDETEFEKASVKEYVQWSFEYFIPTYIDKRVKEGKPASTLITFQVSDAAYEECKYAVEHAHDKTTSGTGVGLVKTASGQPMQETNKIERFQRASDALYTARAKIAGTTASDLLLMLTNARMEQDLDQKRYDWIVEYIRSAYEDEGDPWQWFLRQIK